jgi:hypothetical protein
MSLTGFSGKTLKLAWIYFLPLLLNNACEKAGTITKDDPIKNYSPAISFDILTRLLEGKHINCIESGIEGNIWVGTAKNGVFVLNQ